jgi:hypothetical protein
VLAQAFKSPWDGGLAGVDAGEVVAVGLEVLAEQPRTRAELGALVAPRWPHAEPSALAQAVTFNAALVQVPPRGLWGCSGQATWALAEPWLGERLGARSSTDALVLRYLAAFGPATVADARTWSGLTGLREYDNVLLSHADRSRSSTGTAPVCRSAVGAPSARCSSTACTARTGRSRRRARPRR